jgi:hypothetical protein
LEEAREAVTRIVKDGIRAAEIINGLRSFCKKGAPARHELVDVGEIIREMTVLLRNEAAQWSVSIHLELAEGIPKVMADRAQLQQVFMNLMLNAIEAMRETGGELQISSQMDQDGLLLISVSDTGVGLPPEKADKIFHAFFTTSRRAPARALRSPVRSLNRTAVVCGSLATPDEASRFSSHCPLQRPRTHDGHGVTTNPVRIINRASRSGVSPKRLVWPQRIECTIQSIVVPLARDRQQIRQGARADGNVQPAPFCG